MERVKTFFEINDVEAAQKLSFLPITWGSVEPPCFIIDLRFMLRKSTLNINSFATAAQTLMKFSQNDDINMIMLYK